VRLFCGRSGTGTSPPLSILVVSILVVCPLSVYWLSVPCQYTGCLSSVSILVVCPLSVYWLSVLCQYTGCLSPVSILVVCPLSVYWLSVLCQYTGCLSPVSIIPPVFHTRLHLLTFSYQKDKRAKHGNFQKAILFRKIVEHWRVK
jgi:hypothetical protein